MFEKIINLINNKLVDGYRIEEQQLEISMLIYELEINNIEMIEFENFIIKKYNILIGNKMRSYLVKIPTKCDVSQISKCILFFHGSRDLHWDVALISTNMIHEQFITVYLQGNNQGNFELESPHLHEHYKYVSYGENFFEIRDFTENFYEDLNYVKCVKNDLILKYNFTNFYAIGHSNGGVFVTLFPIYLPNEFKALVSHQGGIGWDEWFNIPFEKIKNEDTKTPIYFYSGTDDVHKIPCIQAHKLFINEEFNSEIYIEDGLNHTWNKSCENNLYNYLLKYN